MSNRTDLSNIFINFLKKKRYERLIAEGQLQDNQFYAVTDGNEKTEYGDLFGNIENQTDLYNALYASRLFKMEMCNDARGYDIVHKLYDRREFDLSKFNVVGNPVISEDGVVSGFSGKNTVKVLIALASPFTLNYRFNSGNSNKVTTAKWALNFVGEQCTIYCNANSNTVTIEYDDNDGKHRYSAFGQLTPNTDYEWLFTINGSKTSMVVKNLSLGTEYTYALPLFKEDFSATGITLRNFYSGSIDLKQFSITVDGEEVFNGIKDFKRYDTYTLPSSEVITIPYIPSVDGVKIVDVAYKPLVDQLYTETGMGNYIIIDETNKTFRLPLPDIYSQIEKKTSFTLRKWED